MRATQHSGRMGSARHNDRNFDLDKASHVKQAHTSQNRYFCCYSGMSFDEAERTFYAENFDGMIQDINQRAEESRHPERKTNPEKLLSSKKTMPEEVIFQIGDKDTVHDVSAEQLLAVFSDFREWHRQKFGDHVKTLNIALHMDETTPHIHLRQVWVYEHEKGFRAIGQHKALQQMGYELPDTTKARGRNNNLKQVYTAECREKWLDLCWTHGFDVNRTPQHKAPNEQNLKKNDFIIQKQENNLQKLENNLVIVRTDLESKIQDVMTVKKDIRTLREDKSTLEEQIGAKMDELKAIEGRILSAEEVNRFTVKKSLFGGEKAVIEGTPTELASLKATAQRVQYVDARAKEADEVLQRKDKILQNARKKAQKSIGEAETIMEQAQSKAKNIVRQAEIQGKEIVDSAKNESLRELTKRFQRETELESKVKHYESVLGASPELQKMFEIVEQEQNRKNMLRNRKVR